MDSPTSVCEENRVEFIHDWKRTGPALSTLWSAIRRWVWAYKLGHDGIAASPWSRPIT